MQTDDIVSPGAHRDLSAWQDWRHRRDRERDQGGVCRLIHHGQRRGEPDHEQRHQDEHRHHGANAEFGVAQQQQGVRGSRAKADGGHHEHYAGHKDEFDDVGSVQRGGSLCLAPPAVRFLQLVRWERPSRPLGRLHGPREVAGESSFATPRSSIENWDSVGKEASASTMRERLSGCRTFLLWYCAALSGPTMAGCKRHVRRSRRLRTGSAEMTKATSSIAALVQTLLLCVLLAVATPAMAQPDPFRPGTMARPSKAIVAVRDGDHHRRASPELRAPEPERRIATFDQDGTLWVEHPMYSQVVYCLDRVPGGGGEEAGAQECRAVQDRAPPATARPWPSSRCRTWRRSFSRPLPACRSRSSMPKLKKWTEIGRRTRGGSGPTPSSRICRCRRCCAICAPMATRPTS